MTDPGFVAKWAGSTRTGGPPGALTPEDPTAEQLMRRQYIKTAKHNKKLRKVQATIDAGKGSRSKYKDAGLTVASHPDDKTGHRVIPLTPEQLAIGEEGAMNAYEQWGLIQQDGSYIAPPKRGLFDRFLNFISR